MMYVFYAFAVVVAAALGGCVVWLIVGQRARDKVQTERRQRILAEEKNYRIPTLEAALAEKDARIKDVEARLTELESGFSQASAKLIQRERDLFDKTTELAELTVEMAAVKARLASMDARLEEQKRVSEAKLAQQQRLSRSRLERLNEAQSRLWGHFRKLFAEVLDGEAADDARLAQAGSIPNDQLMDEQVAVPPRDVPDSGTTTQSPTESEPRIRIQPLPSEYGGATLPHVQAAESLVAERPGSSG